MLKAVKHVLEMGSAHLWQLHSAILLLLLFALPLDVDVDVVRTFFFALFSRERGVLTNLVPGEDVRVCLCKDPTRLLLPSLPLATKTKKKEKQKGRIVGLSFSDPSLSFSDPLSLITEDEG